MSYNFENLKFPDFPEIGNLEKIEIDEQIYYKTSVNISFWYKGEILKFNKTAKFYSAKFQLAVFRWTNFQEVDFNYANFQWAVFDSANFQKEADFRYAKFQEKADFTSANFQKADFNDTVFKKKALFVLEGQCLIFKLSPKLDKESFLEIRNLTTYHLDLSRVTNTSENFLIFDCKLTSNRKEKSEEHNLVISNSILNKLKLINCDFSEAEKIRIENSDITEVSFVNVNWGNITEKRICPELFQKEPQKARDIYRQLKLAHDNQKDHITANEFYALEMKTYERVLLGLSWSSQFQKKFVFSIHKFVSNFGQSWIKPLILIILVTIANMGAQANPRLFSTLFLSSLACLTIVSLLLKFLSTFLSKISTVFKKEFSIFPVFMWMIALLSSLFGFYTLVKTVGNLCLLQFLERFASMLNIFKLFGNQYQASNNVAQFHINSRFIHTIYGITITFLIYQIIVAVRRQVRR